MENTIETHRRDVPNNPYSKVENLGQNRPDGEIPSDMAGGLIPAAQRIDMIRRAGKQRQ